MEIAFENKPQIYNPPKSQLLKWVGNKQKFASEITHYFPNKFNRYFEPFLGSGAILATLNSKNAMGSDVFGPLMEIWQMLKSDPEQLISWYSERRNRIGNFGDKKAVYADVLASYNDNPNGADFLYLSRSCYGGIIRFRKTDGYMSTPCGAHDPIPVESFVKRVNEWKERVRNVDFKHCDYKEVFGLAKPGDLIYCDPPYSHSQTILYGAQSFRLQELLQEIEKAKSRGVFIALSIDGSKKSGSLLNLPIEENLFENEIFVNCGQSMLRRFQLEGQVLENENVSDRLLLTY